MQQVAEGVFVEQGLAPYNLSLILTRQGAILVDVPPQPEKRQAWLEQTRAQAGGPVRWLILTDMAPERLLGALACQLPLIASEPVLRQLDALAVDERTWNEFVHTHARRLHLGTEAIPKYPPKRIALAVHDKVALHWRSRPIQLESVTGGPYPGSLWLWLPDGRVLITGDSVVLGEPPVFVPDLDWEAWQALLQAVQQRPAAHLIPGRGKASAFPAEVSALEEFLRILRLTAQKLAQRPTLTSGDVQRAVHDLRQSFFPHLEVRSEAAQRLRLLLDCQIARYRQEVCASEDEAVPSA